LKGFISYIAPALDMSPVALYERQRALVRSGLLKAEKGRGPGSGVRTSAGSIALLLTAVLATDSLSETEERTKLIAKLRPVEHQFCPLTGTSTFVDAMTAILNSKSIAKKVRSVMVARTELQASIYFQGKRSFSNFAGPAPRRPGERPGFHVEAHLDFRALGPIAELAQVALGLEPFAELSTEARSLVNG
jgi:hypothetical protein